MVGAQIYATKSPRHKEAGEKQDKMNTEEEDSYGFG
jgi:hypothetical protein